MALQIQKSAWRMLAGALALIALVGCDPGSSGGSPSTASPPPGAQFLAPTVGANGDQVRITSINGQSVGDHSQPLNVHAGDVIQLTADLLIAAQNFAPLNLPSSAFRWSSNLSPQQYCDVTQGDNCLANANFQLTGDGAQFYVPANMPQTIQINVSLDPSANIREAAANGAPMMDVLTLRNIDVSNNAALPTTPILSPQDYPTKNLDPDVALAGMGHWVTVNNQRYFAPEGYETNDSTPWAPYQHGYWAWDSGGKGWTWISYDPWGWLTDHYGVWRHHSSYGWVWAPFTDQHYEPAVVSWFDDGDYVGWYPYMSAPAIAPYYGASVGFDDGFWRGFQIGVGFGTPSYRYQPGFSIISRVDFTQVNMVDVIVNRRSVISSISITVIGNSFSGNRVFTQPGGLSISGQRNFLEGPALKGNRPGAATTTSNIITTKGGLHITVPTAVHAAPPESTSFLKNPGPHPAPIGKPVQVTAPRGTTPKPNPEPGPGKPADPPGKPDSPKPAPKPVPEPGTGTPPRPGNGPALTPPPQPGPHRAVAPTPAPQPGKPPAAPAPGPGQPAPLTPTPPTPAPAPAAIPKPGGQPATTPKPGQQPPKPGPVAPPKPGAPAPAPITPPKPGAAAPAPAATPKPGSQPPATPAVTPKPGGQPAATPKPGQPASTPRQGEAPRPGDEKPGDKNPNDNNK